MVSCIAMRASSRGDVVRHGSAARTRLRVGSLASEARCAPRSRVAMHANNSNGSSGDGGRIGERLLPLLRTPQDVATLGPRMALGALLSLPEALQKLPADIQRLSELANEPRKLQQYQLHMLEEVEARVLSYIQRGAAVETSLRATLLATVPSPVLDALPPPVKELLRGGGAASEGEDPSGRRAARGGPATAPAPPPPTWAPASDDEDPSTSFGPGMPGALAPASAAARRAAAAAHGAAAAAASPTQRAPFQQAQAAVRALASALVALQTEPEASRKPLLERNVADARATLQRRLGVLRGGAGARGGEGAATKVLLEEGAGLLEQVESLARKGEPAAA